MGDGATSVDKQDCAGNGTCSKTLAVDTAVKAFELDCSVEVALLVARTTGFDKDGCVDA